MMKHFFQKPNSARRVAFQLTAVATVLVAMPIFLVGCGSGGGFKKPTSSTSRKVGQVSIKVTWPDRTRLIPQAAESIVVVLNKGGAELRRATLVRPAAGQPLTTTTNFDDLPVGTDYTLTATAFPSPDGSGVAQADGSVTTPFSVVDNKQTQVPLTLNTTITQIVLEEDVTGQLGVGRSRRLTAVAMDKDGNIVITSTPKITFSLVQQVGGTATIADDGNTPEADTLLTILKPPTIGTVTVTVSAKDAESGITGSITETVTATGIETTASWAKFHADARNTGRLAAALSNPTGTVADFFQANDQIVFSSPAVDKDGTVYIGAYDGNVYAINPNGSLKWQVPTGDIVEASPAIGADGAIYCGSNDGKLYCIDAATGNVRYAFVADGAIYGSPTISTDGFVYFGTSNTGSSLYAIDGLTGQVKWQYQGAGGGIQTTPAIVGSGDNAVIYFGAQDNTVHGLNAANGTDAFAPFKADDAIYSSSCAVGDDDTIYFGTLGGKFFALNKDLTPKWTAPFDASAPIYSTPALSRDGKTVYFGILDNFSGLDQNFVYALNTADGTKAWSFATQDGVTASPAIGADNTIYITSFDKNLYALNPDGTVKWSVAVGSGVPGDTTAIESSPGFGPNGAIYFGSTDGKVHIVQ